MTRKLEFAIALLDIMIESSNLQSTQCAEIRTIVRVYGTENLQKTANELYEMSFRTDLNDFHLGCKLEVFKDDIKEYIKTQKEASW